MADHKYYFYVSGVVISVTSSKDLSLQTVEGHENLRKVALKTVLMAYKKGLRNACLLELTQYLMAGGILNEEIVFDTPEYEHYECPKSKTRTVSSEADWQPAVEFISNMLANCKTDGCKIPFVSFVGGQIL